MAIDTKINEALLEDLLGIYNEAESIMADKVAKKLSKGITETGWNETKYTSVQTLQKEIESVMANTTTLAKKKVSKGILSAYLNGVNALEKDKGEKLTVMRDLFISSPLQQILLDVNNLMNATHIQVLRNVQDKYRQIQAESTSMMLTGVETRVQATQRMVNKLAGSGLTNFIDKAGRTWNLASYSEMAIRTNANHAAIQGYVDRMESYGMDLVKVSTIGTTCPICQKWQGVVLSLSGKTPGYYTMSDATSAGLFHPNCRHTMVMFDPELDGQGQKSLNGVSKTVDKRYKLTQKQRSNERQIRYWKRRSDLAIDPQEKEKANKKVKLWQHIQQEFCDNHGLKRLSYREGNIKAKLNTSNFTLGKNIKTEQQIIQANPNEHLSIVELFNKYYPDVKPSKAFENEFGYYNNKEYDKWLYNKAKVLKKGIVEPLKIKSTFENVELNKAKELISEVKENKFKLELEKYKKELDENVTGVFSASQEVKKAYNDIDLTINDDELELAQEKYKLAKIKDIETVKKMSEKVDTQGLKDWIDNYTLQYNNATISAIKEHIKDKIDVVKSALDDKTKVVEEAKTKVKAIAKKSSGIKSDTTMKLGPLTDEEADALTQEITNMPRQDFETDLTKTKEVWEQMVKSDGETAKALTNDWQDKLQYELDMATEKYHKERALRKIQEQMMEDISEQWNNKDMKQWYAAYDYTHGSGVYNRFKWGQEDSWNVTAHLHPHGKGMTNDEYGKKWCKVYDGLFKKIPPVENAFNVKRLVDEDGFAPMLGLDEDASRAKIEEAIDFINNAKGETQIANSGFTSTSTYYEGDWSGNTVIAMRVNKGTKAIYGESFSHYQHGHELETLLPANQPLRAIKIMKNTDPGFREMVEATGYDAYGKKYLVICETIPE